MYKSDFTGQEYSKNPFVELVRKRVRKYLRELMHIEEAYCIVNEESLAAKVLQKLLEEMYNKRLDVVLGMQEGRIVMNPQHLEKYLSLRWNVFLKGEGVEIFEEEVLFPFRVVTAHECEELGKIYGLEGEEPEKAENFIEELHKKYPQTKTSMLSSFDFLSDFRKK